MVDLSRSTNVDVLQAANELLIKEVGRLKDENASLLSKLQALSSEGASATLQQELAYQKDLLRRREQELFGQSSERRPKDAPQPDSDEKKPRKGHGPTPQPQLRLVTEEHELPEDQRDCHECGGTFVEVDDWTEDSEEITVWAKQIVRVLNRRKNYRCTCGDHYATAPGPLKLQAGGRYSLDFTVDVAVAKYADHLPLSRLVKIYARLGFTVTTQALWDQLDAMATALWPTYLKLRAEVLKAPLVHADESYWRLMANGKEIENKRYWTWCVASDDLVSYQILSARSTAAGKLALGDYAGIVMADGYGVYGALARDSKQGKLSEGEATRGFQLVNCWAHVRRKFVEAQPNFPELCDEVLALIGKLYEVDREAKDGPPEELLDRRRSLREARSRELVNQIYEWAAGQRVLPRSGLGAAIKYMVDLKPGLVAFLENPLIPLDNNPGERALRGTVLGRKNHLGSRSERGTQVAALFYTLVESAKLSGLNPSAYLAAATKRALETAGAVLLPAEFKAMQVVVKELSSA